MSGPGDGSPTLRARVRKLWTRLRGHHRQPSRHPVLRGIRITAGILLIVLSPLSVFVPLLTGFVMVLAGLSLLSVESRTARRLLVWLKLRFRSLKQAWRRRREARAG